jgi:hypothetical protein
VRVCSARARACVERAGQYACVCMPVHICVKTWKDVDMGC